MTRGTIKPVEFEAIQFVGTGDAAFERIEEIHDWLSFPDHGTKRIFKVTYNPAI